MIKTGDNVRFLNATGGGKVKRVDEKNNMAYVEDEDGFEIPALIRECVVIHAVNAETNFPIKDFKSKATESHPEKSKEEKIAPEPKKTEPVFETSEGDTLKVFLAFFPQDIKHLDSCSYDSYLVNDSNYYLFYNFVIGEAGSRQSIAHGKIEPNTQEFIAEISKENLNDWERLRAQLIAFKEDKTYPEQSAVDVTIKINTVKFYKLHSFAETEYFDDLCMLINLNEESENQQLKDISAEEIKHALTQKLQPQRRPRLVLNTAKNEILEIDLHINELLDNTSGMSNAEMLKYQMDTFHKTLEENKNRKGQKIVFIHGKGEGVLRTEIEKQLKTRYKTYFFQDASFREYGFGATMVTIK